MRGRREVTRGGKKGEIEKWKLVATGWGTVSAEGGDRFLHIIRPVRCKRVTAGQKQACGG